MLPLRHHVLAATALLALGGPALAEPAHIKILQVNDWDRFEEADGVGGYARLLSILEVEGADDDATLLVHAGDAISPSLLSGFDQGEHMISLLNTLPLDVFVMGNHEFDFGPEVAEERMGEATFDVVNSNVKTADGEFFPHTMPSKIIEVNGYKLGFFGITTPDTIELSTTGDLVFEPVIETAERMVDLLREDGADLVIAVSHTDFGDDMQLQRVDGLDLLLTGHDHDLRVIYNNREAMVESSSQAAYVTATEIAIDRVEGRNGPEISWVPTFRTIYSGDFQPSAEGLETIQPLIDSLSRELDVEIGEAKVELDTRRATVRGQQTRFGSLIADAMRNATGADIGLTNGGGIRGDKIYPAGHVLTRRDVLTELPFGNKTVLIEVTGAQLKEALENGVSEVEDTAGRFPHVSGMSFSFDGTRPAGDRVTEVTVGGKPLDPAGTYTVATNDYMASGGDGYDALTEGRVIIDASAATLMANTVANYITAIGGAVDADEDVRIRRLD